MKRLNQNLFALIARILLAGLFIVSGLNKLLQFDATQSFMAGSGIAMAGLLLVITIGLELVAGNMILVGYHARLAAASLVLFLIPVTLIFHNPFAYSDPAAIQQQTNQLLKNLAIMGGLLQLMAFGPGEWSLRQEQDFILQTG